MRGMLEKYLIEHCSPTLAGLKTGSLFNVSGITAEALMPEVKVLGEELKCKGISITILRFRGEKALVYVYREERLRRDWSRPDVAEFLNRYGYEDTDIDYAIGHLKERLEESCCFPHEIGLFLGYPLGDVIGFIENAGKNSKCAGCWKVYCNECETLKLFEQFRKCREIYSRLWKQEKVSLRQLAAAT